MRWLLFLSCVITASCTGSGLDLRSDGGVEDGSIAADASALDQAVADGSHARILGAACSSDDQCALGTCVDSAPFVDGYCTSIQLDCAHASCPSGSACVDAKIPTSEGTIRTESVCLQKCDSPAACRVGYPCCAIGAGPRTCYPDSQVVACL